MKPSGPPAHPPHLSSPPPSARHCLSVAKCLCREKGWRTGSRYITCSLDGPEKALGPTEFPHLSCRRSRCNFEGSTAVPAEVMGSRQRTPRCGRNWRLEDWPGNSCRGLEVGVRWEESLDRGWGRADSKPVGLPLGAQGRERRLTGTLVLPEGDWAVKAPWTEPEFAGSER